MRVHQGGMMGKEAGRAAPNTIADVIVAKRLWLHRRMDALWDVATDPTFTGTIGIEISAKAGRPGEPRVKIEHYGITDL